MLCDARCGFPRFLQTVLIEGDIEPSAQAFGFTARIQ
jgi:hypothetical protein